MAGCALMAVVVGVMMDGFVARCEVGVGRRMWEVVMVGGRRRL